MCDAQPELMQKVLEREFGKLETYINKDGCSGCLIGTTLLAHTNGNFEGNYSAAAVECLSVALQKQNLPFNLWSHNWLSCVGNAVDKLGYRKGNHHFHQSILRKRTDAQVSQIIKKRIRKALAKLDRPEDMMSFAPKPELEACDV